MKASKHRRIKTMIRTMTSAAVICMLLMLIAAVMPAAAPAYAEGEESSGRGEIVIESVEDIPAEDIEGPAVPLAASAEKPGSSTSVRHAVLMGILLLSVTAYAVYFTRYEKKLILLRRQAADAEAAMVRRPGSGKEA